jgi:hypothetical protein
MIAFTGQGASMIWDTGYSSKPETTSFSLVLDSMSVEEIVPTSDNVNGLIGLGIGVIAAVSQWLGITSNHKVQ